MSIKEKWALFKEELGRSSQEERKFIFYAALCGFFIACGYAIVRPVCNSLFLQQFSSHSLPYVWMGLIPLTFLLVSLYNRLIPKWGSKGICAALVALIIVGNGLAPFLCKVFPPFTFFLYMWKEVVVMLCYQLLWSVIHSNIDMKRAKFLYGIFFGIGGVGGILGSLLPGYMAVQIGSENLFFFAIPVYLLLSLSYHRLLKYDRGARPIESEEKKGGMAQGFALIGRSRFLMVILLLVVLMQTCFTLVDFQFNDLLERFLPEKDVRTQYIGKLFGLTNAIKVFLQLAGTYLLIEWIGIKKVHLVVPSLIGLSALCILSLPILPVLSLVFVCLKATDHSIFTISKEMLYIPLSANEKYQAKAVIDVFAYRSSKGIASLLILVLQVVLIEVGVVLTYLLLGLAVAWILLVVYGLREYEKRVSEAK